MNQTAPEWDQTDESKSTINQRIWVWEMGISWMIGDWEGEVTLWEYKEEDWRSHFVDHQVSQ